MGFRNSNLIQVAGIHDLEEAMLIRQCGVSYLGFPLGLPVHKEDLTKEDAAAIIKRLPPPGHAVLITYLSNASEVIDLCCFLNVNIVQLHGEIHINEIKKIKSTLKNIQIIKSLVVEKNNAEQLLKQLRHYAPFVEAFITDTFDPETGARGATGKTHNWDVSRALVRQSRRPVILAGGLTPENVAKAILYVKPAGVDVHTGVENSFGKKDPERVLNFVREATSAFNKLNNPG